MGTQYMTTQNNGLPCYPHKQKHMASGDIHVQTKFSNKSVHHTVEIDRSLRACWPYSRVGCAPTLHKSRWERNLILFFITNPAIVWGLLGLPQGWLCSNLTQVLEIWRWESNLVLFFITNPSIVWGHTVLAMCPMILTRFYLG